MTRSGFRTGNKAFALGLFLLAFASCRGEPPAEGAFVIGGPGSSDGLFSTPRGVAFDPSGLIYAVDRTGRIQKFDSGGRFLAAWRVPRIERGRPTSIACDSKGFLWVADTHYHRVLKYSSRGELVFEFGQEGRGPGEFLMPVGVQPAPDDELFVSEFGGNDRIQVFDSRGTFRRAWGSFGTGEGEFNRPQGLSLSTDGRLYVADSANHRVVVYDRLGRRLVAFGSYGSGPGELKYPYGVAAAPDGSVYVAEYGNHRIQRFSSDGRALGSRGGPGTLPGKLHTPWSVAVGPEGKLVVCDTENHRLQVWEKF